MAIGDGFGAHDKRVLWHHGAAVYDDHPPPHIHVHYGEHAAVIEISTLRILRGSLPRRALSLVLEWSYQHRPELFENWERALAHQALQPIQPLE